MASPVSRARQDSKASPAAPSPPAVAAGPAPPAAWTPVTAPPMTSPPPTPQAQPPPAPAPHTPPAPAKPNRGLQALVETLAIFAFLCIIPVPLARVGLVPLEIQHIHLLLAASSFFLIGGGLLFPAANFAVKKRTVDEQLMRKFRRDMILTTMSVGGTITVAIMLVLEAAALLAFLGFISNTSSASVAFASNYVFFGAFTLLVCSMLLIVRTSFETRVKIKSWHAPAAYAMLATSAIVTIVALLVNYQVLNRGPFAALEVAQSVYIFTLAVLLEILAFKLLLRYPGISQIVVKELEAARRANKEMRDVIQRRAVRAYIGGMLFVVVSMFLVGGVLTQRLPIRDDRTGNFIVLIYLIVGGILLGLVVTRYLQHKFLAGRAKRRSEGELIATRRLSAQEVSRRVILVFSVFLGFLFFLIGLVILAGKLDILEPKYGTDFIVLAFLVGVGPYGWYRGREMKRVRAMDDKFPDFLRDLAESERAGMTLPRALSTAAKGVYGALTEEIKLMNAQVEWGVSFTDALLRFSRRVHTPLIERTVALIVEASRAGGNVIDILTAASDDAREIKQILEERRRQMGIYGIIIYIAFFVFLIVVYILSAQFLPAFDAAVSKSSGTKVSGATIAAFDIDAFITVFYHAALIQGIGGGLVSGIMQEGHPLSGLKHSVIMSVICWFFFRILVG